jgi:hypothetical protein
MFFLKLAAVRPFRPKPEIEDLIYCNPTTMIQIQARNGAVPARRFGARSMSIFSQPASPLALCTQLNRRRSAYGS